MEARIAKLEIHAELTVKAMGALRVELRASVADLRNETRAAIDDLRGELRASVADLRAEIRALREKVDADVRMLTKRMDQHFYIMLGGFTGLAGLMAKGFHWF